MRQVGKGKEEVHSIDLTAAYIQCPYRTPPPSSGAWPPATQESGGAHREGQVADKDGDGPLLPRRVQGMPVVAHVVLHLGAEVVRVVLHICLVFDKALQV